MKLVTRAPEASLRADTILIGSEFLNNMAVLHSACNYAGHRFINNFSRIKIFSAVFLVRLSI
jgi:hypothetical protein